MSLPSLSSRPGSGGSLQPADALPNVERAMQDERLGHSGGFRGPSLRPTLSTSLGGALPSSPSNQSAGQLLTNSSGGATAGLARLAPAMAALDASLACALTDLAARNSAALQAVKDAADLVVGPARGGSGRAGAGRSGRGAHGTPNVAPSIGVEDAGSAEDPVAAAAMLGMPVVGGGMRRAADRTGLRSSAESAGSRGGVGANGLVGPSRLGVSVEPAGLGPRWGATEGGRDELVWVRSLTNYAEAHPLFLSDSASPETAPEGGSSSLRKPVFPASARPDRREDAALLANWLADMVGQLSSHQAHALMAQVSGSSDSPLSPMRTNSGSQPGVVSVTDTGPNPAGMARPPPGPSTVLELVEGVLQVYGVAFQDMKRQVSTECRERGELLSVLWGHWSSAVQLRANLAAEAKLGDMQAEYVRLMGARDQLSVDVATLQSSLAEAGKEAKSSVTAQASTSRSLAGKLAAAQARAEELTAQWRISDLALNNEVERRQGTQEELATTKALLVRTEHEWLAFRAQVSGLEQQNATLVQELKAVREELNSADVATHASRGELESLMGKHAVQDVHMARMRRDWETDEILITAFKQQVRELEAHLAQLKAFQRDQAVKLGSVAADKDAAESDRTKLQVDLTVSRGSCKELGHQLATVDAALTENQAALKSRNLEYESMKASLESQMVLSRSMVLDLNTEVNQLTNARDDEKFKLSMCERNLREANGELGSLREMLSTIALCMESQGADGVPRSDDKGWEVPGPLGAAQRTSMLTNRQLGILWRKAEDAAQEVLILRERLQAEMVLMARLTGELHQSRTLEAYTLAGKEDVDMRLDISNQARRMFESDALSKTADLVQSQGIATRLVREAEGKDDELLQLRPLRRQCAELTDQVADLTEELRVRQTDLTAAKQDVQELVQQLDYYKKQIDRLIAESAGQVERIKEMTVFKTEAEELRGSVASGNEEIEALHAQLHVALDSHTQTLHQLETSRFFLQGLNESEARSAGSITSQPSRPGDRPGSGTSEQPKRLSRPGTAPGSPRQHSLQSVPPSGGSSRLRISTPGPDGDVQMLPVSFLDLGVEGTPETDTEGAPETDMVEPAHPRPSGAHLVPKAHHPATRVHSASSHSTSRPSSALQAAISSAGSRPLSAASSSSSTFPGVLPEQVVVMLESKGVGQQLHDSAGKWMRFKLLVIAQFSARLRSQLTTEREKSAALQVALAQVEVTALEAATEREAEVADAVSGLRGHLARTQHDLLCEMRQLREQMPEIRMDVGAIAAHSCNVGLTLRELQATRAARKDCGVQTNESLGHNWAMFIQSLPSSPPLHPMAPASLGEAIVRIYLRALPTVESTPVWGAPRCDTVYDHIMHHYTSSTEGNYTPDFLQDIEGPVGRLLRTTRAMAHNTRAGLFAALTGVSPDGTVWSSNSWHFLLHTLHCLQLLLGGTWRSSVRAWMSSPLGAALPLQAVYDLVSNLYNVQLPTDLENSIALRLAALVVPDVAGPQVDLDALLLLLVTEFNLGACPRAALLFPRRCTDGRLFNLFNNQGHSPQTMAITDGRAATMINSSSESHSSTSNPNSPLPATSTTRHGTGTQGRHKSAWPISAQAVGSAEAGQRPMTTGTLAGRPGAGAHRPRTAVLTAGAAPMSPGSPKGAGSRGLANGGMPVQLMMADGMMRYHPQVVSGTTLHPRA